MHVCSVPHTSAHLGERGAVARHRVPGCYMISDVVPGTSEMGKALVCPLTHPHSCAFVPSQTAQAFCGPAIGQGMDTNIHCECTCYNSAVVHKLVIATKTCHERTVAPAREQF